MKNKFLGLALSIAAAGAILSGCEESATPEEAMNKVKNFDIACMNNSSPLDYEDTNNFELVDGQAANLVVATKWVYKGQTVSLNWDFPTGPALYKVTQIDNFHKLIEFNFNEYGGATQNYTFTLESMTCSGKTLNTGFEYECKIKPFIRQYDEYSLAQLTGVTEGKYDIINYDHLDDQGNKDPWFDYNYEQEHLYIKTKGKITYVAPDGDWALLAAGNSYIELFGGGPRSMKSSVFSACKVGTWCEVRGNMAYYNGNMQIAFISSMREIEKGALAEPAAATEITATTYNSYKKTGTSTYKYEIDDLMNSMKYVKGHFKTGTLKDSDAKGKTGIGVIGKRYTATFVIDGGAEIKLAYDYHTVSLTAKQWRDDPLLVKLNEMFQNPNKSFKLTGTIRYESTNNCSLGDIATKGGVWTITPTVAADVVAL